MKSLVIWVVLMWTCGVSLAYAERISVPIIAQVYGSSFIKHQGQYVRAKVGMELAKGDEVLTSARSKIYIDFPDQSRVKLGVRARFVVHDWHGSAQGVFESSLSILSGAFRYTAHALKAWKHRKTTIYTNTAVLGVRGTDFWGRVDSDDTFFLLLEGSVSLATKDGESITFNQAGYVVHIQDSISSPQAFPTEKIAPLAAETEI